MTIYGTFPLLVPGKTVSVSLYGLQKTSGTILFKPGEEGAALTLAEQNGSIFPDPQVRTTDMGLLEMSFDAYTDTGVTSGVFGTEIINLSKSFEDSIPNTTQRWNWTITEIWIVDSYTERKVLAASLNSIFLSTSPRVLGTKLLKRVILGRRRASGASSLSLNWQAQVSSVTRRNFGTFDEVDIVTSFSATVL
jgi:hypothetical protein